MCLPTLKYCKNKTDSEVNRLIKIIASSTTILIQPLLPHSNIITRTNTTALGTIKPNYSPLYTLLTYIIYKQCVPHLRAHNIH